MYKIAFCIRPDYETGGDGVQVLKTREYLLNQYKDIDEEKKLHNVRFIGGCDGNLKSIGRLVEGQDAKKISDMLSGVRCGFKDTSCGDQFSHAIREALEQTA